MINVESLALSDDSTTPVQGGRCPNFTQVRTSPQWLEYRDLRLSSFTRHYLVSEPSIDPHMGFSQSSTRERALLGNSSWYSNFAEHRIPTGSHRNL